MKNTIPILLFFLCLFTGHLVAQNIKPGNTEDSTLGVKPTLKVESLSPAGHCDKQQLSFFAPWADHYEIQRRRIDTAWINDNRYLNSWFSDPVKPHVTSMIYTRLDEHATLQFVVIAYKGTRYLKSELITLSPCIEGAK